jgi:hypothetical protein
VRGGGRCAGAAGARGRPVRGGGQCARAVSRTAARLRYHRTHCGTAAHIAHPVGGGTEMCAVTRWGRSGRRGPWAGVRLDAAGQPMVGAAMRSRCSAAVPAVPARRLYKKCAW